MAIVNVTMIVIFMCVALFCVVICMAATLLCYMDYMKQKRGFEAEIEHMREEVRACRKLLQDKANAGQHKTSGC